MRGSALICDARHGVGTGSGSDRVAGDNEIELAMTLTRSLPLPVLTSSIKIAHYPMRWRIQKLISSF